MFSGSPNVSAFFQSERKTLECSVGVSVRPTGPLPLTPRAFRESFTQFSCFFSYTSSLRAHCNCLPVNSCPPCPAVITDFRTVRVPCRIQHPHAQFANPNPGDPSWSSSAIQFFILHLNPQVLSCGVGECVGGDGTDRKQAALVQTLAGFPAVWMACGNSHSVVIGSGGEAVAFGLNTHGQVTVRSQEKSTLKTYADGVGATALWRGLDITAVEDECCRSHFLVWVIILWTLLLQMPAANILLAVNAKRTSYCHNPCLCLPLCREHHVEPLKKRHKVDDGTRCGHHHTCPALPPHVQPPNP